MLTIFLNPFERQPDQKLLLIGLLAIPAGAILGWFFNARFDGVLDLHFTGKSPLSYPLIDIVISLLILGILLFLLGKHFNPKTRVIDIFNACSIAKIPFYLLAVFNFNDWIFKASSNLMKGMEGNSTATPGISEILPILLFGLISMLGFIWAAALLFNGYKVATNAKGIKSTVLFITFVVLAEVVSKMVISTFN